MTMLFSTSLGHRIRLFCCLIAMVGMLTAGGLAWFVAGVPESPYGLLSAWSEPLDSQPPPDRSLAIWDVYGLGTSWQRAPDALAEIHFLYGRYDASLAAPSYSSPFEWTLEEAEELEAAAAGGSDVVPSDAPTLNRSRP